MATTTAIGPEGLPANKHSLQTLFDLLDHNPEFDKDQYNDREVRDIVLFDPIVAHFKYSFEGSYGLGNVYPLAWAASLGASLDTVKTILDANPDAIRTKDRMGRYPLHTVCYFPMDTESFHEVLPFLIESYPVAVEKVDRLRSSPLLLACLSRAPLNLIRLLADRCPESIEWENCLGETPLNRYIFRWGEEAQMEMVKLLVGQTRRNVWTKVGRNTPLHFACEKEAPLDIIWFLAEAYPEALVDDEQGETPIQLAEEHHPSEEVKALLHTLHKLLCLQPSDDECISMLQQSEVQSWHSQILPILDCRPGLVHIEGMCTTELIPPLLERVGREGRVQTTYRIIRESMSIFQNALMP